MPLGQGIGETLQAVRNRIELSGHGPTWQVTAGSFDSALGYARERFGNPVVLERKDRTRWWPRVTITVTTDPRLAASAPPLEEVAQPVVPAQRKPEKLPDRDRDVMPACLEAIFAHQEQLRG
jgi:hypothetical protein